MAYSKRRIWSWEDVSPHFKPEEVMSPDTLPYLHLIDVVALHNLNEFRKELGKSLFVNHGGLYLRGVRSPKEQLSLKEVGGALYSQHVQGKAFDLTCSVMDWSEFVTACKDFWPFSKQYPDKNFIHVDNRNRFTL
jgi:hypothetical protein